LLAVPERDRVLKPCLARGGGETRAGHCSDLAARELAFGRVREGLEEALRHDESQHGIA